MKSLIWFISLSVHFLMFISQYDHAEGSTETSFSSILWMNIGKANELKQCLTTNIANSPDFTQEEKEDFEFIVETMLSDIYKHSSFYPGKSLEQLKAINTAFASALAELLAAESAGNAAVVSVKASVLIQLLNICFQTSLGVMDTYFISELLDLIELFTKEEAVQNEENETDYFDDYSSSSNFETSSVDSNALNSLTTSITSEFTTAEVVESKETLVENFNSAEASAKTNDLINILATNLQKSEIFKFIFSQEIASQLAGQIAFLSLQSSLSTLSLTSSASLEIGIEVQNEILKMGPTGFTNLYALIVASNVISGLSKYGIITASNTNTIINDFLNSFIKESLTVASSYGINYYQSTSASSFSSISEEIYTSGTSSTSATATTVALLTAATETQDDSSAIGSSAAASSAINLSHDDISGLLSFLENELQKEALFNDIIGSGILSNQALQIVLSALHITLTKLSVSTSALVAIENDFQSFIHTIGVLASVNTYAQGIASSLIYGLLQSGELTASNRYAIIESFYSTFLKTLSEDSTHYGINVLQSDSGSSSVSSSQVISSSVTSSASAAKASGGTETAISDTQEDSLVVASDDSSTTENALSYDAISVLINFLANGLQNAAIFSKIIEPGISSKQAGQIVMSSLSTSLTKLSISVKAKEEIENDFQRYIINTGVSASVNAYAQGIASCVMYGLLQFGELTTANSNIIIKTFFSTFLKALTENATSQGINLLQSDSEIISSSFSQATSNSSTSLTSETVTSGATTATSYSQVDSLETEHAPATTTVNALSYEAISVLINSLAHGLQNAALFKNVIGAEISSQQAVQIVLSALHITLDHLSVSSSATLEIQNQFQNYINNIGVSASVNVYAEGIASCFIYGTLESGEMTVSNRFAIIKTFFSTFLKVLSEIAASNGFSVLQTDSGITSYSTSQTTSSSSVSSTSVTTTSAATETSTSKTHAYSNAKETSEAESFGVALSDDAIYGLINFLVNGLQKASVFNNIIEAGISSNQAGKIVLSALNITLTKLSISSSTKTDIENYFQSYITDIGISASVSAYAEGIATCFIIGLLQTGELTESNRYAVIKTFYVTFLKTLSEIATFNGISVLQSASRSSSGSNSQAASGSSTASTSAATSKAEETATSETQGYSSATVSAAAESSSEITLSNDIISGLINIIANGLQKASIFNNIIGAEISSKQMEHILLSALHIALTKVSGSSSVRIETENYFQRYMINTEASTSVIAYAQAVASCFIYEILESGELTVSNRYQIIKTFFSAFLKALLEAATSDEMSVLQSGSDSSSGSTSQATSSSSTSLTSATTTSAAVKTVTATTTAAATVSATTTATGTAASETQAYSNAAGSAAASTGITFSDDAIYDLINVLVNGLQKSSLFNNIIEAGISSNQAGQILLSALNITLTKLSISSSAKTDIENFFKSYIIDIDVSASVSVYAEGVATCFIIGLLQSDELTESNIYAVIEAFFGTFLKALSEAATLDGINVLQSAFGSSTGSNKQATSSSSTSSTSATTPSATGTATSSASSATALYAAATGFSGSSAVIANELESFRNILSSPVGITSNEVSSRIQALIEDLLQNIVSGDFGMRQLAYSIASASSEANKSGLPPLEAIIEALLEVIVALVQILSSSELRSVDFDSINAISKSFVSSLILAVL